jgi:hypothetical protein
MIYNEIINSGASPELDVGLPNSGGFVKNRIYLVLYDIVLDPSLRNVPLSDNLPPPMWLILKYILISHYDEHYPKRPTTKEDFDSFNKLGKIMSALHYINYLSIPSSYPWILNALKDNPEHLKLTFDQNLPEIFSKIISNFSDKYFSSIAFQIRPVLIASSGVPTSMFQVGIDYTQEILQDKPVDISVNIFSFPVINSIFPLKFEGKMEENKDFWFEAEKLRIVIKGKKLNLQNPMLKIGQEFYAVDNNKVDDNRVECEINYDDFRKNFTVGSYPLFLFQKDATTNSLTNVSNAKTLNFLPYISSTKAISKTELELKGRLLGNDEDSFIVAFYDTNAKKIVEEINGSKLVKNFTISPDNKSLKIKIIRENDSSVGLVSGKSYLIFLRINNHQAREARKVTIP